MSSRVERCSAGDVPRSLGGREGRRRCGAARRVVVSLVELACCLSCCSAPSEPSMGYARTERERNPTGESAAGPAGLDHLPQAPRLSAIALRWLSGLGLKSCPQGQLATK